MKMKIRFYKKFIISDGVSFCSCLWNACLRMHPAIKAVLSWTRFQEELIEPKANSAHRKKAASLQFRGPV